LSGEGDNSVFPNKTLEKKEKTGKGRKFDREGKGDSGGTHKGQPTPGRRIKHGSQRRVKGCPVRGGMAFEGKW